jgi:hypothetical protein
MTGEVSTVQQAGSSQASTESVYPCYTLPRLTVRLIRLDSMPGGSRPAVCPPKLSPLSQCWAKYKRWSRSAANIRVAAKGKGRYVEMDSQR